MDDQHQSNLRARFIKTFDLANENIQSEVIHSICSPLAFFNPLIVGQPYDSGLLFDMMYAQGHRFSEYPLSLLGLEW